MGKLDEAGKAGRTIAGLLGYNPGPGIYSRLERAVQEMPANVRVEELPGLLKRYKEGVPGWELKAADFPGLVGDAKVIPRQDLLDAVRQRSPVYTHREVVLGGTPPMRVERDISEGSEWMEPSLQDRPSPLGLGISHGEPHYKSYGQGGKNYAELLLLQPGQSGLGFGSHWSGRGIPMQDQAVAHARFDTHGDALRINELQSDLGIHNRKAREARRQMESQVAIPENYALDGSALPFPLEDAWSDLLIKRLALQAARGGHRAIEIASPQAIADKVGGNIDNYEHFYGKVAPGMLERLGRKMGGLTEVKPLASATPTGGYAQVLDEMQEGPPGEGQPVLRNALAAMRMLRAVSPPGPRPAFGESPTSAWNSLANAYRGQADVEEDARILYNALSADLTRGERDSSKAAEMMPQLVRLAETHAASLDAHQRVNDLARLQEFQRGGKPAAEAARRYIMSDEMRRRIIEGGIGAAVAAPVMSDDDLIERLNQ